MPRSKIVTLPRPLRERLDVMLIERGFSGYRRLANWLAEQGHSVSHVSVHRYGSKLEKRLERARTKAEEVQAFVAVVTQDQDALAHEAGNAGVLDDLQEAVATLRRHFADLDARVTRLEERKA